MKRQIACLLLCLIPIASPAGDGLVERTSPYPVAETLDRMETLLKAKGVKVFARIDHAAEAQGAGLTLRPAQLLIFGNPKAGTPLMQAAPSTQHRPGPAHEGAGLAERARPDACHLEQS